MADLSLKSLKVVYVCQDKGKMNTHFDRAVRDLAKKFGIKWYAQGRDHENGNRDICFGETIKG